GGERCDRRLPDREEVALYADAPDRACCADGPHRAERDEGRMSSACACHVQRTVTVADFFAAVPAAGDVLVTSAPFALQDGCNVTLLKPAECRPLTAFAGTCPVTSGTVAPSPLLGEIVTVVPLATWPAPGSCSAIVPS